MTQIVRFGRRDSVEFWTRLNGQVLFQVLLASSRQDQLSWTDRLPLYDSVTSIEQLLQPHLWHRPRIMPIVALTTAQMLLPPRTEGKSWMCRG